MSTCTVCIQAVRAYGNITTVYHHIQSVHKAIHIPLEEEENEYHIPDYVLPKPVALDDAATRDNYEAIHSCKSFTRVQHNALADLVDTVFNNCDLYSPAGRARMIRDVWPIVAAAGTGMEYVMRKLL